MITASPPTSNKVRGSFGAVLVSLLFVELIGGVLHSYFIPVYPLLGQKYGVGASTLSWALIGFALAGAVSTPLFARLGDIYGHHRVLRYVVALIATGSVLIAAAPNFAVLVVGRVLQGIVPVFLPLMIGLLRSRFSADRTRRAIAYMCAIVIVGSVAASLVIGLLVRAASGPEWALWLPVAGTLIGFGLLFLAHDESPPAHTEQRVDWPGALLLSIALIGLLLALNEGPNWGWFSPSILIALIVGIVSLVGWVVVELRVRQPLANVRFLFRRQVAPIYVVGFSVYIGAVGGQVAMSTFMGIPANLGYGLGLDTFTIEIGRAHV